MIRSDLHRDKEHSRSIVLTTSFASFMPDRFALSPAVLTTCFMLLATTAHAGSLSNGQWAPAACGVKPEAPTLNLSNEDAYNKSVDGVNTYRLAARNYLDCLVKEANADIQSVTKQATAAQQATRDADDKIKADVKKAEEKFK